MLSNQIFVALLICLATTFAEPPRWRSNTNRSQRLQAAPPAPAQGKPQPAPHTVYGPPTPAPTYGPPSASYGPPKEEPSLTTTESLGGTTQVPTTTEVNSELIGGQNKTSKLQANKPAGAYYIYHPNGVLQKVSYIAKNDDRRMAFNVNLKYENVDPIRGPIYTYDPRTLVFQKIREQTS